MWGDTLTRGCFQQVAAGGRLVDKNIQGRSGNLATIECLQQGILIDDTAATGVGNNDAVLHLSDLVGSDQVAAGYVDGNVVRPVRAPPLTERS